MRKTQNTSRKREIVRLYDSSAAIYNRRYSEIQSRKYDHIGDIFTQSGNTLDVGCGTGLLLCHLGRKAGLLVGIDTSKNMLRVALRQMRKRRVNGDLVRADAHSLPFRRNVFAAIASVTVLQNLSEPRRAISEIARVAVLGGKVGLSCLKKKYGIEELRKAVSMAHPDLEITAEWDDNEEDAGINLTRVAHRSSRP